MRHQQDKTEDDCFALNLENRPDFAGGLLLQNTSMNNFHTGVNMGLNANLTALSSSFVGLRGGSAIKAYNPASLKLCDGIIVKCESNGVWIQLDKATAKSEKARSIVVRESRIT